MIDYRVRSVSLLNLINDVRSGRLIPDAYFQRNIVWREIHNKDFIKTILLGFPFPQIFISKGKVNVETMTTISCIVDGQQRTNAINLFINNEFDVNGVFFQELTEDQKSDFLKYEIAVIELDLENDDPKIKEIFQRINRTSNSLSSIEKLASEYSTSAFMLVAKLLSDQIDLYSNHDADSFREDPNIPAEFYSWAKRMRVNKIHALITEKNIFNAREISRKVHLIHILNIMSTVIGGFFTRNEKTIELLNDYFEVFEDREEIVIKFNRVADLILNLKLRSKSIWFSKSNFFSLFVVVYNNIDILVDNLIIFKTELENFENDLPENFKLAATEGVNNRKERQTRNDYILAIVDKVRQQI